ncbi:MAG: hypothetical protein M3O68_00095, partial [Thermoproteota archaeon]|nr:hypothetical protein [Thermoproteota archaeon]
SWTASDNERVKFNLNVDPNYKDAIGGCKMSFKDSMARGYTYDKTDLDNVELTGFFNVHKPTENDGIYLRGPCNHHDESDHLCCEESTTTVKPIAILRRPVQQPNSQSKVQTNIITTLQGLKR